MLACLLAAIYLTGSVLCCAGSGDTKPAQLAAVAVRELLVTRVA